MNGLESVFDDLEVGNPCTIICEAYEEYRGAGVEYNRVLSNAQILSNQIVREYNLNCKQAKVRCLKEGGTMDDYAFYEAAAEQGALGKLRSIIESIIKFFKELCQRARTAINTKICSAKAKSAVDKMEKQIKLNPALAAEKVTIPDNSELLGLISRQKARLDQYDAKLIAGLTGKKMEARTLLDTIEDFNTAVGSISAGTALTCAITLGALVVNLKSEMEKLPGYLTTLESSQSKVLNRLLELINDDTTAAATMAALQQTANFRVQLNKQELDTRLQSIYDKIKAIQDAIQNAKGKYQVNVNVMEDGKDSGTPYTDMPILEENMIDEAWFEQPFFEGANSEIRAASKAYRTEFSAAMKAAKAAYKSGDYVTARKELYKANAAIDKGIAAINAVDKSDTSSALVGTIVGSTIMMVKALLAAIPTFGLGAYVVLLNETLKQQKEVADSQNKHNLDVGDYNVYRNQQKAHFRNLRKVINAMLAKVQKAEQGGGKKTETKASAKSKEKSSMKNESWDEPAQNDTFLEDASEAEIDEYLEGLLNTVI